MQTPPPRFAAQIHAWLSRATPANGVRRLPLLPVALGTEVGNVRPDNQDQVCAARWRTPRGRVFSVLSLADGIGGLAAGSDAAAVAQASFVAALYDESSKGGAPGEWLSRACLRANQVVYNHFGGRGGSTLVAALLLPEGTVHWLSVGDSRVYVGVGATLNQLSKDDTLAGQLGRPSEAGLGRSDLLQFVGMGPNLEPHVGQLFVRDAEYFLLSSDGAHAIKSEWMGLLVHNSSDPAIAARRLLENSKWCGGTDNASVAVLHLSSLKGLDARFLDDSWIELFDPFGELVVQLRPQEAVLLNAPEQDSPTSPPDSNSEATANGQPKPVDSPGQKPKRPRKAKQSASPKKQKREPGRAAVPEGEVPQLLMEFPNKKTDRAV